jgi:GT2 family glycosyltransferase
LVKYDWYNFGKINNELIKNHVSSDTKLILFCNDDIELLNDCLSRVVDVYQKNKNVGTVGIRLHYGDNSVQHNGIYVMLKDNDIHLTHIDLKKVDFYNTKGYYSSAGNTGAFLFIKKELFDSIGGFNENYIECFEDVELNLECINRNFKNITIFDAVAYHYESLTRNKNPDKIKNVHVDYETLIKYISK